jgi:hypothetical protein
MKLNGEQDDGVGYALQYFFFFKKKNLNKKIHQRITTQLDRRDAEMAGLNCVYKTLTPSLLLALQVTLRRSITFATNLANNITQNDFSKLSVFRIA